MKQKFSFFFYKTQKKLNGLTQCQRVNVLRKVGGRDETLWRTKKKVISPKDFGMKKQMTKMKIKKKNTKSKEEEDEPRNEKQRI